MNVNMRLSVLFVAAYISVTWVNSLVPRSKVSHRIRDVRTAPSLSSSRILGRFREIIEDETAWKDSQKEELQQIVNQIDSLQMDIQEWDPIADAGLLEAKQAAVTELEAQATKLLSIVNPPEGLTMLDFQTAINVFFNLPPQTRLALITAIGMKEEVVTDPMRIPEIVSELYVQRNTLTRQRLIDSLKAANTKSVTAAVSEISDIDNGGLVPQSLKELLGGSNRSVEEDDVAGNVQTFLPRVTRKKDQMPTEKDLEILMNALDNKLFLINSRPIQISGGYVIRGENRRKTGQDLISALDQKLPGEWDCTVVWILDVSDTSDEMWEKESRALVLLKKDFSPNLSDWLYRLVSLISLGTILLFSIGVYGTNNEVLNRLTDASALNDFAALDWFNGKVGQVLGPIVLILASHEFGHFLIARKDKIETTSLIPTFLPIFGSLPLLGTLTRIKSSPRNFTSLFDFALSGPLLGFVSSFLFLGTGLIATKAVMDGDGGSAAQHLPALPVSVINLSTLGGSIIDYFFAGGEGFITNSDPSTPLPLHPFAIAGYCGLLINAAEMLPLGATDGGRLSMTIFGRRGHTFVGGLTWFALLVASFTLEDNQASILITAWATNNVFQNDMEVPCRDESDSPKLPRIAVAFALWFLAALVIIPL
jgi:hypothetical protein